MAAKEIAAKKYVVKLSEAERSRLQGLINKGKIVLVQDNLNTRAKASLFEAFAAAEAINKRVFPNGRSNLLLP
jgi:hypothetical protein